MLYQINSLTDNYIWVYKINTGFIVIDPGESEPVINFLKEQKLIAILITHHHQDHIGGVSELKEKYHCAVYANKLDLHRIKGVTEALNPDIDFNLAGLNIRIIATKGHTSNSVCYYLIEQKILFTGDSLFSLGCGRLFEGSANDMFNSLAKIKTLPSDTIICPAHEYTLSNLDFCLHLNKNKSMYEKHKAKLLAKGGSTLPVKLKDELELNPFLLAKTSYELKELRERKDRF